MYNMSCAKPSSSHFQFNELVLSNFRLMYNVTVFYATCSMNVIVQCIYLHEVTHIIVVDYFL